MTLEENTPTFQTVEGIATVDSVDAFVADIAALQEQYDTTIQVFDARYVAGRSHLERAVALAQRATELDDRIADDPAVEILLYAAGRRQIQRALEMGVSPGECPVVAVVVGGDETGAAAALETRFQDVETLDSIDEEVLCDFFEITGREREATAGTVADIVCERVSMLVVEK